MRNLRHTWWLAMGAAAAFALSGCPAQDEQTGGGGGDTPQITHDRSNPVTREQEGGALPLRGSSDTEVQRPGHRIEDPKATVISRGGEVVQRVNINEASVTELTRVPGVSATLARSIVQHRQDRPFSDAQDLAKRVPHLTMRQVSSIQPYIEF